MKNKNEWYEDDLGRLVRDLTRVGSVPKSEARRRIVELVAEATADAAAYADDDATVAHAAAAYTATYVIRKLFYIRMSEKMLELLREAK